MADWTEKYRPSTLSEVRGNDKARDAFADWARSWDDHHEAVVLHGGARASGRRARPTRSRTTWGGRRSS